MIKYLYIIFYDILYDIILYDILISLLIESTGFCDITKVCLEKLGSCFMHNTAKNNWFNKYNWL